MRLLVTELKKHSHDLKQIEEGCPCPTCSSGTSRALLHHTITIETAAAHGKQVHVVSHLVGTLFTHVIVRARIKP